MSDVFDALSPQQRTDLLLVFHILQLTGGVGIALVLGTIAFAKSLKPRHPLAINMMFCSFLYALVSCMLLFSGYSSQPDVPFALCLADAAFINAVTLMTTVSSTALVIHLWVVIQSCVRPEGKLKAFLNSNYRGITHIFLVLPYIVFIAWTCFLLILGLHYPAAISKRAAWFYCTLDVIADQGMGWIGNVTTFAAGSLIIVAIIFEVFIVKSMWKHRIQMRSLNTKGWDKLLVLRIGLFSGFSICMILAVALVLLFPTRVMRHILLATVPFAVFLFFGPQGDLLACWFGWLLCHPRKSRAEWMATPVAMSASYTPRSYKRLLSWSSERVSPRSGHQYPGPVTGVRTSTTDNQGLRCESHPSSNPALQGTAPFLVSNPSAVSILQTLVPSGERPSPYHPPPGNSEPGFGAMQMPPSAHIPRKRGAHSPQAVTVIRQSLTSPVVLVQSPSSPDPSILRPSDSS